MDDRCRAAGLRRTVCHMDKEQLSEAQQAVNVVAPMMAGHSREDVERELRKWLDKRSADLPEPYFSRVVGAITSGSQAVVILP